VCDLHRLSNDLVEFGGEGAEDPCHHNAVQSSPIDGRFSDVGEDVVVEVIATKREEHEVAPPLVVRRRGFQTDCDHRSYILEADNLCVLVRSEDGIGVGAGIDGVIAIVILGDHDPFGSGELLFQVTGDGLLLLPSEGDGMLACPCLIQGLACSSHGGDERLLLSVFSSGDGMSHNRGVLLLPLSGGGGRCGLLLINGEVGGVARHGQQDSDGGWR
jgi:hypothetical protein